MADKQIIGLPAAAALDGTELVHVVQGGNSRRASIGNISGLNRISTHSPSNVATLDIPIPSGYRAFRLVGWLLPAVDEAEPRMLTSTDAGANFDEGASDYGYWITNTAESGVSATVNSTGSSYIRLIHSAGSQPGRGIELEIDFLSLSDASRQKIFRIKGTRLDGSGTVLFMRGNARRKDTTPVNMLRFQFGASGVGNIADGEMTLLGVPEPA